MPTILLKKSDTASAVPTTANLTNLAGGAEVAVNTADRRMFTMNSSSAVVELGTNPSSLTVVTGANLATTSGNVGIGTSSAGAKLDIRSGNLFFSSTNTTANTTLAAIGVYQVAYPTTNQYASIEFLNGQSSWFSGSAIVFKTNGSADTTANAATEKMRITGTGNLLVGTTTDVSGRSGTISDISGNVRAIPRTGSAKTSTYTLTVSDVGQFVELGTGGAIDVPNGVFSTGDVVSVFNNTNAARTMSLTITTAYIGGTDADRNSVSLATRGVATILFISNSVCVLTGNVS